MIHDSFIYCTILQKELSVYSSLNIFFYFFLNIQLSSSFSSSYFELRTFTHHAEIPFLNFSQDTCHPHILFLHLLSPFSILFFLFLSLPAVQPWMSSSRTNSNSTKGEDEETPTEFEFLTIRPIISRCYLFQIKRTISTHPAATFHFLSHLVSDKLFHLIIETYLSSPFFSLSRTQLLLISFFHPSFFSMLDESLSNR